MTILESSVAKTEGALCRNPYPFVLWLVAFPLEQCPFRASQALSICRSLVGARLRRPGPFGRPGVDPDLPFGLAQTGREGVAQNEGAGVTQALVFVSSQGAQKMVPLSATARNRQNCLLSKWWSHDWCLSFHVCSEMTLNCLPFI